MEFRENSSLILSREKSEEDYTVPMFSINYSQAKAIDKKPTGDDLGYTSNFLKTGDEVYFEDFNVEVSSWFSKNYNPFFSLIYINYNKDVVEGRTGFGHVYSTIGIVRIKL